MAQLAKKYNLHPNMITNWKRQAIENMQGIFANKKVFEQKDCEEEIKELHAKITPTYGREGFFKKWMRALSKEQRVLMIEQNVEKLSIDVRCNLVGINCSSYYSKCKGESAKNLSLMRMIDSQFLETPYYGSRQMVRHFARHDHKVSRVKMRRLMRKLGLQAVYQAPKTSTPHPSHKIYPYLLREKTIKHSNQVWCTVATRSMCARYAF
jgi:putative transposase